MGADGSMRGEMGKEVRPIAVPAARGERGAGASGQRQSSTNVRVCQEGTVGRVAGVPSVTLPTKPWFLSIFPNARGGRLVSRVNPGQHGS